MLDPHPRKSPPFTEGNLNSHPHGKTPLTLATPLRNETLDPLTLDHLVLEHLVLEHQHTSTLAHERAHKILDAIWDDQ